MKVSDRAEGLLAKIRGVNSSVSLSLQGTRMTDHQRLEGYWKSGNWVASELSSQICGNMATYTHASLFPVFFFCCFTIHPYLIIKIHNCLITKGSF